MGAIKFGWLLEVDVYADSIVTAPPAEKPIKPILFGLILYFLALILISSIALNASFDEKGSIKISISMRRGIIGC